MSALTDADADARADLYVALDGYDRPCLWRDPLEHPWAPLPIFTSDDLQNVGDVEARDQVFEYLTRGLLELIDRQGNALEDLYGCNCDGYNCTVAQCQMETDLEGRAMGARSRGMLISGARPEEATA